MKLIVRITFVLVVTGVLFIVNVAPVKADVVTLNPSKDNTLYENAAGGLSNGAGAFFFAGKDLNGNRKRGVIAFDIAGSIPAGSTINSVTLDLYMSRSRTASVQTVRLFKLLEDWGEGTSDALEKEGAGADATTDDATWLRRFHDTTFWTSAGGHASITISASRQVGGVGFTSFFSTAQMVADVQEWLDVPSKNFGWLVIGGEGSNGTAKRFNSKEFEDPEDPEAQAKIPVLTVDYTPGTTSRMFFGVSPGCVVERSIVTIAADSTFGGQFYKYFFKPPGGGFQVIEDWGTQKTAHWLSSESGINIVVAQLSDTMDDPSPLRQMGGTYDVAGTDCQHPIYVTLSPASGVVNEAVTITAVAEGTNLQYRFYVRVGDFRPPSTPGPWTRMENWGPANSFQYTPLTANVYTLVVHVTSDTNDPGFGQGGMVYVVGQ